MTGAEVAQAKKDYEDRQMKKLADEKKREREADRVHKAKVKVSLLSSVDIYFWKCRQIPCSRSSTG